MQARRFFDSLFYDDYYYELDYYESQSLLVDDLYDDEEELYAGDSPYIYGESDDDDFDVEAAETMDAEDYLPSHQRAKLGERPTSDVDRHESGRRYRRTCYRSWKARRKTQYH